MDDSFLFSNLSRISKTSEGKISLDRASRQSDARVTARKVYRRLPLELRVKLHSLAGKRATGPLELTQEEKDYVRTVLADDIARLRDEYGLVLLA